MLMQSEMSAQKEQHQRGRKTHNQTNINLTKFPQSTFRLLSPSTEPHEGQELPACPGGQAECTILHQKVSEGTCVFVTKVVGSQRSGALKH